MNPKRQRGPKFRIPHSSLTLRVTMSGPQNVSIEAAQSIRMIVMPKSGPFAYSDLWPLPCCPRSRISVLLPMISLLLAGCGGGEDFSKPPSQIQNQLAKAASDPAPPADDGSAVPPAEAAPPIEQNVPATDAVAESPAVDPGAAGEPSTPPASDDAAANSESVTLTPAPAAPAT